MRSWCKRLSPFPLLMVLSLTGPTRLAQAEPAPQDPAESQKPAAAEITPPVLTHQVGAILPEGVTVTTRTRVLLELAIDATGKVIEARLVEGEAMPFGEAAIEAVRQFTFEPARRGDTAIPVRIRYQYVFEATPAPAATTEPAPATTSTPLPSATPPSGAPSALPLAPPSPLANSDEPPVDEGFEAIAEVEAPPREVTRHTLGREELRNVPGTSGDALRAIEVLPGVARTSSDQGDPILRGAAWNESRSFIEGDTVPLLFHFGGVKSAFNSELLGRVDLYPSNFSARFGRATGGILDAKVRDPRRDRWHGIVELSVLDSMALLETPVGQRGAVAVAARRSNLDFFFEQFVPKDKFRVLAAPVYWDYQAIGTYQVSRQHSLRLLAYGSRDSLTLLFSEPSSLDPSLRGSLGASIEYHRVQAALTSQLGSTLRQRVQATFGTFSGIQDFGPLRSDFKFYELFGRAEWSFLARDELRVNAGLDFEGAFLDGRYEGPQAPQNEGNPEYSDASMSTFETQRVGGSLTMLRPAAYLEFEWHPTRELLVVPGIRTDYDDFIGAWTLNPRLAARYQFFRDTALKWGVGLYSQSPEYYQSLEGFGNPELKPYHALHLSAGVEQQLGDGIRVGADGFYKHLTDRVVMTPGGAPPIYLNDGRGRIYGAELFARVQVGRTSGYLAYTLSRSERQDRADPWRLFDKDQTHILVMTMNQDLGRGWLVGGRFRLISGNPYTPVIGAAFDAGIGSYRPLHGPVNSARTPLFHQLDLRVEKKWWVGPGAVSVYLDLQNAYNAEHVEGTSYSFDYARRQSVYGMPIIPNLGVRGEL